MAALDYALHTLGWRAFQDLCGVVLQQVLGQTFTTFADTNDAGRDGPREGGFLRSARGEVEATLREVLGEPMRPYALRAPDGREWSAAVAREQAEELRG